MSRAALAKKYPTPKKAHTTIVAHTVKGIVPHASAPPGGSITPAQMRQAYNVNQITFGNIVGDGTGQTIAIIDAYDYPTAYSDLQTFDATFGLPDPPSFRRVAQDGSQNFPPVDPAYNGTGNLTWETEEALDIEWAHAMAPGANILLVEANDSSWANLVQKAAVWAADQPGVSVVSMSWGSGEFFSETSYDTYFTTPTGHNGVTFVASTGDSGQPGTYPAFSPNVVAVGGTTLTLNGSSYGSETGWSGSGGGVSLFESQPSYQKGVVTQSSTQRTVPDLAMDADPNSGVPVYDSFDFGTSGGWFQVGGTSLAAPMVSGLIAIANQGRALAGLPTLNGRSQTLPALYSLSASDFHDITTGNNGSPAGPGYDTVTGLGTPIANLLVPGVAGVGSISGTAYVDANGNGIMDPGETPLAGAFIFIDSNGNGVYDPATMLSASANPNIAIPDNNTTGIVSALSIPGSGLRIADVNVTVTINHPSDSDLVLTLIGPDGTQVVLASHVGSGGVNFKNTTFDDQASTPITSGTAPYTGSFIPVPGFLSAFDGRIAGGTWQLKVVDSVRHNTGTLVSWSLAVTTAPELSTISSANGTYMFNAVPDGPASVLEIPPLGYVPTSSIGQQVSVGASQNSNVNLGAFPTAFTASAANEIYYLWLDPTHTFLNIGTSASPTNPAYQIAVSNLPTLNFQLTGPGSELIVDFSNGAPLPAGGLNLDGGGLQTSQLSIIGQSSGPQFTMTDTQIGLTGGPTIQFQNLGVLSLTNADVQFTGTLDTLSSLNLYGATNFNWS
jgi:subtilisin-like proprotein convertase family protein